MNRGHKNSHNDLSPEFIRETFDYEPKTGILRWKMSLSRRASVGRTAGYLDQRGRRVLGICGKNYYAHRIIWVWMTGKWPSHEVDHIDRIASNNRWKNLRLATSSENHRNRGPNSNNTSGFKGVTYDKQSKFWVAQITHNRRRHRLGSFATKEAAYAAYCKAAKKIHGEWASFK